MNSLVLENLTKRFGATMALDGVSLSIEPGEMFFLLGPSGCGKTTLLRSIAGFTQPDSGRILFGEKDVTAVPPHRRNTAMMFQSYALWPHLNVEQNVAFGLEERRVPREEAGRRVAEALGSVRMGGLGGRAIHELSGGQQQRVALARALVVRPHCLLLDEPLSNLDAKLRMEMRAEIRRVCKESGLTAVYVTHDQKEALSIADRMALMDAGQVRQCGTPAELYRRPQSRFVADFMGETNFVEGRVAGVCEGRVVVATALGEFEGLVGRAGWQPQAGAAALLSIRPESWRLGAEPGGPNRICGRLGERVYLGEMAQYEFHCGAQTVRMLELNPRLEERGAERELWAAVAAEDVVALPG